MPEIRIISAPGLIHLAVTHQQSLLDYALWYPGCPDQYGDIYYGRVTARLPAIGGVFVLLSKDQSGFLPDNAGGKNLSVGDKVVVHVSRSAQNGKSVRLDTRGLPNFEIKTSDIHQIQRGLSPLETFARHWEKAPIYLDDLHLVHLIPSFLHDRIQTNAEPIPPELYEQIEALEDSEISLPMGVKASITPTPALIAIDMDSAALSQENQLKIKAQFHANRNALPVLLHQLQLRNLSGAILLDLIGLPIKKRRLLQTDIENALSQDPLSPKLLGFTHLGLVEIIRPRKRPPLHEQLSSNHGMALKVLNHVKHDFFAFQEHYRYQTLILSLHPHLYQGLIKDEYAINDFERQCSVKLQVKTDPTLKPQEWDFSYE